LSNVLRGGAGTSLCGRFWLDKLAHVTTASSCVFQRPERCVGWRGLWVHLWDYLRPKAWTGAEQELASNLTRGEHARWCRGDVTDFRSSVVRKVILPADLNSASWPICSRCAATRLSGAVLTRPPRLFLRAKNSARFFPATANLDRRVTNRSRAPTLLRQEWP